MGNYPVKRVVPGGAHHHLRLDAELLLKRREPEHHGFCSIGLENTAAAARIRLDAQLMMQELLRRVTPGNQPQRRRLQKDWPLIGVVQRVPNVK